MQNQSVLFSIAAAVFLFGSVQHTQAGTATNIIKKTTGLILGATSVGTAIEIACGSKAIFDFKKSQEEKNMNYSYLIFCLPSLLLNTYVFTSTGSDSLALAARLALLVATGYGSYKLLKPSADEQESDEEEYEYSY